MLQKVFLLRGASIRPKAVLVNGSWRAPSKDLTGKKLAFLNRVDALSEPRPVSPQVERVQSRIVKAKKRHDLDEIRKRLKKYPSVVAEKKKYELVERLEDKIGSQKWHLSWQEKVAIKRRKTWKTKRNFGAPHSLDTALEIKRALFARLLQAKPGDFLGTL